MKTSEKIEKEFDSLVDSYVSLVADTKPEAQEKLLKFNKALQRVFARLRKQLLRPRFGTYWFPGVSVELLGSRYGTHWFPGVSVELLGSRYFLVRAHVGKQATEFVATSTDLVRIVAVASKVVDRKWPQTQNLLRQWTNQDFEEGWYTETCQ